MLLSEIIASIRVGIREIGKKHYSDADITTTIETGISAFGLRLKAKVPALFNTRVAVASTTHVFAWPSDCVEILNVWDLGTTAGTVAGASNASPIVITETAHGRADGDIVNIHGVLGNTAANGVWAITYIGANSYSLDGSTGNDDYTSGGLAYTEPDAPDEITLKVLGDATGSTDYEWYPRGRYIVVDDYSFTNDILLDYSSAPDEVSDIPSEYHHGLVSWGVVNLMRYEKNDPYMADKQAMMQLHSGLLRQVMDDITTYSFSSTEPKKVRDVWANKTAWRRF
jgi:hypothetical protein